MASNTTPIFIIPVIHQALNKDHKTVKNGWIMSYMDAGAAYVALEESNGPAVTKAVKNLKFLNIGLSSDIFYIYGEIIKIGRTSINVRTKVVAKRRNKTEISLIDIATSDFIFVAINSQGRPRKIS